MNAPEPPVVPVHRTNPTVHVRGLELQALIGVHDWEHRAPQRVRVSLEGTLPHARACTSDALADTVDYAAVIDTLHAVAQQPHRLCEALAQRMAVALLGRFGWRALRLRLSKLEPFPGAEVGVSVDLDLDLDLDAEMNVNLTALERPL